MRETIIERDAEFSGSVNPMLAVHGEESEARQYSGRVVDDDWVCPFRPRTGGPKTRDRLLLDRAA